MYYSNSSKKNRIYPKNSVSKGKSYLYWGFFEYSIVFGDCLLENQQIDDSLSKSFR